MPSLVEKTIAQACHGTAARTRARTDALAKVRWVLATDDGRFVFLDEQLTARLTHDINTATTYDGRDNEEMKCRFMEALLSVPLSVVLIDE